MIVEITISSVIAAFRDLLPTKRACISSNIEPFFDTASVHMMLAHQRRHLVSYIVLSHADPAQLLLILC